MNHYVKYFLCLLCSIVFQISLQAQSSEENQKNTIIYQNNFDAYNHGDYLASVSPDWTTWNNNPGSSEDALISALVSLSDPNSVNVVGSTDLVYSFGNLTSGAYLIEFDAFIPYGKAGYFNLQHVFASEWALEVYFHSDGSSKILASGEEITNHNYSQNTWFHITIEVNMINDWAKMYWDEDLVSTWQWSYKPDGTPGTNQLACANFYVGSENGDIPDFFFDNFVFSEIVESENPPVAIVDTDEITIFNDNGQLSIESFNIENGGELDLEFETYPVYNISQVNGNSNGVIGYTGDNSGAGLGWENGSTNAKCAVLLTPSLLSNFIGTELTAIEFYVNAPMIDLVVKVWEEGSTIEPGPQNEIYSITHYPTVGTWNTVSITDPIVLDGTPLYIGIEYFQQDDLYCIGLDDGPKVEGVNFTSVTPGWRDISLDRNLNIRGITNGDPQIAYLDILNPSGTIIGGDNLNVYNEFNPVQLDNGTYIGQIVVASNDPVNNYDYVDYSFTVQQEMPTTVSILPANQFITADETFETTIEITDVFDLGGFEIDLNFDPAYLQANSVTLMSFLGSSGREIFPLNTNINNTTGLIEYAATTLGANPPGPDGDGVLLTIEWTSANISETATTAITIDQLQLTESDGSIIPAEINHASIEIATCFAYDFDCDCDVDIIDVTMIAYEYGWECPEGKSAIIEDGSQNKSVEANEVLRVAPAEQTVGANENFSTEIEIQNISNLGGFELELSFDAAYLQVNSVILESFLGSTGRTVFPLTNTIDNTNGLIEYAVTTLGPTPPGPDGNGVLLTIEWTSGSSTQDIDLDLILQNVQVAEPNGTIIPVSLENGLVTLSPCHEFDFDCDCDVDIIDITMVSYNYGWECGGKSASNISFDPSRNKNIILKQEEIAHNSIEKELVINLNNIYQLGAYELKYAYNPDDIEILSIKKGDFLANTGRETLEVKNSIDEENGLLQIALGSLGNQLKGAEGDGELLRINYRKTIHTDQPDFELQWGQLARIDAVELPFKSNYIKNNSSLEQFEIAPNPNNGEFFIYYQIQTNSVYSISLYAVSGEEFILMPESELDAGQYQLNITDLELPSGMYLIKMKQAGNSLKTEKLIIY